MMANKIDHELRNPLFGFYWACVRRNPDQMKAYADRIGEAIQVNNLSIDTTNLFSYSAESNCQLVFQEVEIITSQL